MATKKMEGEDFRGLISRSTWPIRWGAGRNAIDIAPAAIIYV